MKQETGEIQSLKGIQAAFASFEDGGREPKPRNQVDNREWFSTEKTEILIL